MRSSSICPRCKQSTLLLPDNRTYLSQPETTMYCEQCRMLFEEFVVLDTGPLDGFHLPAVPGSTDRTRCGQTVKADIYVYLTEQLPEADEDFCATCLRHWNEVALLRNLANA